MRFRHKIVKEYQRIYQIQEEIILKKLQTIMDHIEPYKKYLKNGNYRFVTHPKELLIIQDRTNRNFLKKLEKQLFIRKSSSSESKIKLRLFLFFKQIILKKMRNDILKRNEVTLYTDNKDSFQGSLLMNMHGQHQFKIFDFTHSQTLTVGIKKDELKELSSYHNLFFDYFSTPIKEINVEEQLIYEDIITTVPYANWSYDEANLVIIEMFSSYTKYLKNLNKNYIKEKSLENIIASKLHKSQVKFFKRLAKSHLNNLWDKPQLLVPAHGDLYFSNILKSEVSGKHYLIDYEHANDYVFYFDCMWTLLSPFIIMDDDTYLINYLKGDYDSLFIELFSSLDETFELKYRDQYLIVSLIYANGIRDTYDLYLNIKLNNKDLLKSIEEQFEKVKTLSSLYPIKF